MSNKYKIIYGIMYLPYKSSISTAHKYISVYTIKKTPEFLNDISYLIVDVIEISLKKKLMKGYCADIGLSFEKLVSAL